MFLTGSALLAFALAVGFTTAARSVARRLGFVAAPRADRWHRVPVALLGGVAIFAAFATAWTVFAPDPGLALPVLGMAALLFAMGLVDDIRPLKPYAKLVVQLLAAAVVVASGLRLPWFAYDTVNGVLTIFWLVGITNAMNLLDNMDGLAAGIAVIASGFLAVNFLLNGQTEAAFIAVILAGAALGFLVFNFHPASIFMGDSGAMFLGFALAGTALLSEYGRSRGVLAVLFTPVLILLLPIFDTCLVTVTRRLSGRAITQGGRDHTSHRLVALGLSERRAVVTLYGFAVTCGALALGVRFFGTEVALLLVPAAGLAVLFVGLYLGKLAIYERPEQVPAESTIIRALVDFQYKRRVFEVLLDVVLVVLAYYAAYVLRFDGSLPPEQVVILFETLPLVIGIQLACFLLAGLYRGLWRYAGFDDVVTMVRAVAAAVVASAVPIFALYGFFGGASRVVFILDGMLLLLLVAGSRLSFRLLRAFLGGNTAVTEGRRPVLIYGAGDGGALLMHEMLNNSDYGLSPVGFIDDDARKVGKLLNGLPIYHRDRLVDVIRQLGITDVVVSSSKVPDDRVQQLRAAGVTLKRMRILVE